MIQKSKKEINLFYFIFLLCLFLASLDIYYYHDFDFLYYSCVSFLLLSTYYLISNLKKMIFMYKSLFEQIYDPVVIINQSTGEIVDCNIKAGELLGYTKEELLKINIKDIYCNSRKFEKFKYNIFEKHEEKFYNKNGEKIDVLIISKKIELNKSGFFCQEIWRNKTLHKENADKIIKEFSELYSNNKVLQDFVHIASHDLQAPIRKIKFYTEKIKTSHESNNENSFYDYLNKVSLSCDKLKKLIEDLTIFSKINYNKIVYEKISINDLVEEIVEENFKEIEILLFFEDNIFLYASYTLIKQLFYNILSNSVKYRHNDRTLNIKITKTKNIIKISDNGVGFNNKYKETILVAFNRLYTDDEIPGTGIGLAICSSIMKRHNGEIETNGRLGEGCDIILKFPREVII